jgi:hypothetical protein
MTYKWTVWSLDVWGNESEGFNVNDRCKVGQLETSDIEDSTILAALIESDYLVDDVTLSDIRVSGDDYFLMIDDAKTGMPTFQLSREEDI